ncbi:MAG: DEAD/DEAH box helicase family protein [Candidatus Gracilibacteria bacterium]|nr:DEAD/DEAH box helicase family protein [Candidatus Gracilibacteria bacterium]
MFAIISPFTQSLDDIGFVYKIPSDFQGILKNGMIVHIPFGKRNILGLVLTIAQNTDFDKTKIKEITSIYNENIFLNNYEIELLKWISTNYFSLIHICLNLFFPKNLLGKIIKNKFGFNENIKEIRYDFKYQKTLNQNQSKIFNEIISSNENKFLLYGVTGSGKTEIYINLIKHYLEQNKQILLLVPEIILTNQILQRLKKVFGLEVIIINSTVSEAKKTLYREMIYNNKVKIIVGTRSAIFYPYNNLGLIIVDEEHDNSYISDNSPRYDTIEVVNKITDLNHNKLLLGSGTPKINHLYNALNGNAKILNLFNEFE